MKNEKCSLPVPASHTINSYWPQRQKGNGAASRPWFSYLLHIWSHHIIGSYRFVRICSCFTILSWLLVGKPLHDYPQDALFLAIPEWNGFILLKLIISIYSKLRRTRNLKMPLHIKRCFISSQLIPTLLLINFQNYLEKEGLKNRCKIPLV